MLFLKRLRRKDLSCGCRVPAVCNLQCLLTAGVRSVHSPDLYNLTSKPSVEFIALQTGSFLSLSHSERHGEEAITLEPAGNPVEIYQACNFNTTSKTTCFN